MPGPNIKTATSKDAIRNLFIGHHSLRGLTPNDKRFEKIETPSKTQKSFTSWKKQNAKGEKTAPIALKLECANGMYQPKFNMTLTKEDRGLKVKEQPGRDDNHKLADYIEAQKGAAPVIGHVG